MKAYIFANGIFPTLYRPLNIQESDLVIAADGGSQHCQFLGIHPGILIGDLDSTDPELVEKWREEGVEIIQHPEDKDQTDLELALMLAQDRGARKIVVHGAVGGRLDMTFGNLSLLAHPLLKTPTTLVNGAEEVHLLHAGEMLTLVGEPGEVISLLPIQPGNSNVSTRGLKYTLKNEPLEFGFSRGISNQLIGKRATVHLESGLLAVIHTRTSPPEET
ncbi:MAG: thiamine diphosphokinase [Anaerolineales bacterium]|nr:thiamine diphosphokinase [Anaerolineales bacterium]